MASPVRTYPVSGIFFLLLQRRGERRATINEELFGVLTARRRDEE